MCRRHWGALKSQAEKEAMTFSCKNDSVYTDTVRHPYKLNDNIFYPKCKKRGTKIWLIGSVDSYD